MNFIINKEEYLKAKSAWTSIPNRDAADHIIYNALRGFDLKRGFSPTQSVKLTSGYLEWQGFDTAKGSAQWRIRDNEEWAHATPERKARKEAELKGRDDALSKKWGTEFTPELLAALRELLK